jgi:hypothetical protein
MKIYKMKLGLRRFVSFGFLLVLIVLFIDLFFLHAFSLLKEWSFWVFVLVMPLGIWKMLFSTITITNDSIKLTYLNNSNFLSAEITWPLVKRAYSNFRPSVGGWFTIESKDGKRLKIPLSFYPDELSKEITSHIPAGVLIKK